MSATAFITITAVLFGDYFTGGSVCLPKLLSTLLPTVPTTPALNKPLPPGSPSGAGRLRGAGSDQAGSQPHASRTLARAAVAQQALGRESVELAFPAPPRAQPRAKAPARFRREPGRPGPSSRVSRGCPPAPSRARETQRPRHPLREGCTGLAAAGDNSIVGRQPEAGGAPARKPGGCVRGVLTVSRCPPGPRSSSSWPPPARSQRSPLLPTSQPDLRPLGHNDQQPKNQLREGFGSGGSVFSRLPRPQALRRRLFGFRLRPPFWRESAEPNSVFSWSSCSRPLTSRDPLHLALPRPT